MLHDYNHAQPLENSVTYSNMLTNPTQLKLNCVAIVKGIGIIYQGSYRKHLIYILKKQKNDIKSKSLYFITTVLIDQ